MAGLASGAQGGVALSTLNRLLAYGPVRQKIVPDGANSFYVVARNDRDTAFAHRFIRNMGGADSTDTGVSYPCWRYCGTSELAGFDTAPTSPAHIYSSDIGAQDYALLFSGNGLYGGSYHGGETLGYEAILVDGVPVDPLLATTGSQVVVTHTSTITSGGASCTLDFTVTVKSSDGSLAFAVGSANSAASFNRIFMGMVIGTGAYNEARFVLHGGSTDITAPIAVGTTYLANAATVRMRDSSNGRTIRVRANMPAQSGFRRTKIIRTAARTKLYFEGVNGVMNAKVNLVWTVHFDLGSTGNSTFATNLLTNGNFDSDLAGWTATHNPSGVTWNDGKMRFTRSASAEGRAIQGVSTTVGGVYLLSGEDVTNPTSAQGIASIGLTSAANGSTSSPAPAYAPVQNEVGYNAHVVIATQATSYAMALQQLGTAGQTSDLDGMALVKLADSA